MYLCPVCGYSNLSDKPYDEYGCPSYEICSCCGTEFGYDDNSTNHLALREKWISNGMNWWSKSIKPPKDWNPLLQLGSLK